MARTRTSAATDEIPERIAESGQEPGTTVGRIRLPNGLRAFVHRDYRIFWFSQLISLTGTWMQSLAQSWLVLTLTNSPAALGLIGVLQFAPTLVLGIPAGVLVDRVPKRRLLQATQAGAAMVTGILALLVATNRVQLWQVYAAAFALGVINSADMPARQAFVVDLVGADDLMNAIALNSALFNTTRVIGPAVAGVLLAVFGPAVCFVLNAVSYLPVVAGLMLMRTPGYPHKSAAGASPLDHMRQGLSYVRRTPAVRSPIILVGLIAIFGMNFAVWAPLLARDALQIGASGFGLLMSSLGVGSLFGALTLAFSGRRPDPLVMLGSAFVFGIFEILLGVAAGLGLPAILAMVCMAGTGFAMSVATALANTTIQSNSPDRLRGRVMSIYLTVFAGSTPLGYAIAGITSGLWGAPAAVAIGGAVVSVAALVIGGRIVRVQRAAADRQS